MKELRAYQREALQILSQDTSGLDASGLGCGKTLTATMRLKTLGLEKPPRVLVVAPVNTLKQWRDSFLEQYPSLARDPERVRILSTPGADPEGWKLLLSKKPGMVFCIGWEAMRGTVPQEVRRANSSKRTKNPPLTLTAIRQAVKNGTVPPWTRAGVFDLVIADEVHRITSRESQQAKVLKLIQARNKLGLSGTPAGNREEGLWSVLNWLWKDRYRAFWPWVHQRMRVQEKYIGRDEPIKEIAGEKHPGATWEDIPCVVRHRTEDVADQLPGVIERTTEVKMNPEQRRIYDDFEEQAFAWLDDHPVSTPLPLTQRIRLRQAALGQIKVRETVSRKRSWVPKHEVDSFLQRHTEEEPQVHTGRKKLRLDQLAVNEAEFLIPDPGFSRLKDTRKTGSLPPLHQTFQPIGSGPGRGEPEAWKPDTVTLVRVSYSFTEEDIAFDETAPQAKLDALKEILSDLPPAEPVLVFTHSAKWARMATAALNKDKAIPGRACSWTGDLNQKGRQELKEDFGRGVRVIIAVVAALSEGVDGLQDVCHLEVWASPSEDGIQNEQAQGRLNRPGQKHPVQRWLLHSTDSIDTVVDGNLRHRRERLRTLYRDA